MDSILTLKHISKTFEGNRGKKFLALKSIDLEIFAGEFLVILGPSGSGKSTLLRIMSGLESEYDGRVEYGGITSSDFGFVFQQFALFPWLTVFENIAIGLRARQIPEKIIKERVKRELKRFNLERFANAFPRELSGGMKQRVGIARALVVDPKIIFMDEPFSQLDSFTAEELKREVLQIWQERKPTIVMVTHLVEEALELSDRIVVLTPLPGRIKNVLINPLPRPRNKRSQEFFEIENEIYKLVSL